MSKNSDFIPPIFDIETAPIDFEDLAHLAPARLLLEVPNKEMQQDYKDGLPKTYKDETRQKKLNEWMFKYDPINEQDKWMKKAQLDPTRSFVCWLCVKVKGEVHHLQALDQGDEYDLLREAHTLLSLGGIGHFSNTFDLPFLFIRAVIQGVPPIMWRKGRYAKSEFVDTGEELGQCLHDRNKMHPHNLDFASKLFGWDTKPMQALDFWPAMLQEKIDECKEYAEHDVNITEKLARRLGLLAIEEETKTKKKPKDDN